jgi:cytosine/adenosine deaminase-related metal-dependent hydrolase
VIDARGKVVLPGLVNTHHHLYQTLTRAVPAAQNAVLFDWLKTLYPIWAEMDADAVYTSTLVGCAELMLSGCTGQRPSYIFQRLAARRRNPRRAEIGLRFRQPWLDDLAKAGAACRPTASSNQDAILRYSD